MLGTGNSEGAILDGGTLVVPGVTLKRTPNPDLKWERSEQLNLGIDFSIFNNRLNGTVDYFSKRTRDVLLEVYSISPALPPKYGAMCPI